MLNIGKLGVGGGEYYLEVVASGVEDYYLGAGEAPGYWHGAACHHLGLHGKVTPSDLQAVLAGSHPRSGTQLRNGRGGSTVPAFDLTFRAPKTVSLLWALSPSDVAEEVRECHDSAVHTALAYLERHALASRRGPGGVEVVDIDGGIVAVFRHRTSRAGDPLLHSHCLLANLAHTTDDGRWRTLYGRRLYRHAKTAGYVYQAALRHELTTALGVEWEPVVNGTADLKGVPRPVIEHFSRRRADILAALHASGHSSAKAAQVATLATRQRKEYGVTADTLHDRWVGRAKAIGFGPSRFRRLLFQTERRALDGVDSQHVMAVLAGPDGLTANVSTFTRRDVTRAWCEHLQHGAPLDVLERVTDSTLAGDAGVAIPLTPPHSMPSVTPAMATVVERLTAGAHHRAGECQPLIETIRVILDGSEMSPEELAARLLDGSLDDARDPLGVLTWRARQQAAHLGLTPEIARDHPAGRSAMDAPKRTDEPVYSTPDLLQIERHALRQAADAVATVSCDPALVGTTIAQAWPLSDEQATMIGTLTTSNRGVQVVVGRAGAGKTTALANAVPLWRQAGCTVTGAALAARTARQLGEATGIPFATVDRLLAALDANPPRHHDVIVVDEAAMVGTRQLATLIDHTSAAGARLVLIGDHHQLPEIQAGGLFAQLTRQLPSVELTINRRQHDPTERDAVDAIRDGRHQHAIEHFTHPSRHTVHDTADQAYTTMTADWWADHQVGRSTTMLAAHQQQVEILNMLARHRLQEHGRLYGPEVEIAGAAYQVGDEILCLRNNRRLGVLNGTTATIDAIDPDSLIVHATTSHGQAIVLPGDYVQAGRISHAYATTVHKAQGRTLDTAHVLLDDTAYREMAYVMLSRHRHTVHLHTTREPEPQHDAELHPGALEPDSPPTLDNALDRSCAQHLAHATLGSDGILITP